MKYTLFFYDWVLDYLLKVIKMHFIDLNEINPAQTNDDHLQLLKVKWTNWKKGSNT